VDLVHVMREAAGVVAVWKPAGLATQAPPGIPSAESWLRKRLHAGDTTGYLGVPHRLDRGVSGVVLFAATPRAARQLSRQFERRQIRKAYLAIVACRAEQARETVAALVEAAKIETQAPGDSPGTGGAVAWHDRLEKIIDEARARVVPIDAAGGREAVTLARLRCCLPEDRLLLELAPLTGRMHQLRVQAASRGLPVIGDDLYGKVDGQWTDEPVSDEPVSIAADPRTRPIALHAYRIEYADPDSGLDVKIEAPLPTYWPAAAR